MNLSHAASYVEDSHHQPVNLVTIRVQHVTHSSGEMANLHAIRILFTFKQKKIK